MKHFFLTLTLMIFNMSHEVANASEIECKQYESKEEKNPLIDAESEDRVIRPLAESMPIEKAIAAAIEGREPMYWSTVADHFEEKFSEFSQSKNNPSKINSLALLLSWSVIIELVRHAAWEAAENAANNPAWNDEWNVQYNKTWREAQNTFLRASLSRVVNLKIEQEVLNTSDQFALSNSRAWSATHAIKKVTSRVAANSIIKHFNQSLLGFDGRIFYRIAERESILHLYAHFPQIMNKVYNASLLDLKGRWVGNFHGLFSNYEAWEQEYFLKRLERNRPAFELARPLLSTLKVLNTQIPTEYKLFTIL